VVCGFIEITQVDSLYGFGGFFLIELDCFIVYFFSHVVEKKILERNHVIKFYEVTKIKRCEGNQCSSSTHCIVDYNSNPQCFAFFFLFLLF
jgi:hypothetical protein